MESYLSYQGIERREILGFLRRMCLHNQEEFLDHLCKNDTDNCTAVEEWLVRTRERLEAIVRDSHNRSGREALALSLLYDGAGLCRALERSKGPLCQAWHQLREQRAESILWNVLSQHLKSKMDELDGVGQGHGTHILRVRRHIDILRKELEGKKGCSYTSLAELAADITWEIRTRKLSNMPTRVKTVLDYLYDLEAMATGTLDPWDDTLEWEEHLPSDALVLLEQCIDRLSGELFQALSLKFGLENEPAFVNEEAYCKHYGIGREAMRKRTAKAKTELLDCLKALGLTVS